MDLLHINITRRKIRSGLLLAGLLALIASAFILPTAPGSSAERIMAVVYLVVFSVASYLIGARRNWLITYGILAAGVWAIGLTDAFMQHNPEALAITRDSLLILLQVMLVALVFRFSMFDPNANGADRIVAGISGYLIIALMWARLYALHEAVIPGGLVDSTRSVINPAEGDLLYFSFVTQTTTGYGEILPVSASARLLASLQSVTGTLYLAVFIAALLGRNARMPMQSTPPPAANPPG